MLQALFLHVLCDILKEHSFFWTLKEEVAIKSKGGKWFLSQKEFF